MPENRSYGTSKTIDGSKGIEISQGIYWVGNYDEKDGLSCNPYLIVEGDEAVIIDAGNRTDFSNVMLKVLGTGVELKNINTLIYQHYDPDLCSSIPHLEALIDREDITLLSHRENNVFIKYYGGKSKRRCVETENFEFKFKTGRVLKFIRTPYSHSAGSFMTYDEKSGILFSSDIFGFWGSRHELYIEIPDKCTDCDTNKKECVVCAKRQMWEFHKRVMTSEAALKYAMERVEELPVKVLAPQHGGIFTRMEDIRYLVRNLKKLKGVGIDGWS